MYKKFSVTLLAAATVVILPVAAQAQEECFTTGPGSAAVAVPTECPESSVPPTTTVRELPQTGVNVAPLALSGLGVLAAGGTAVFMTRRRDD